VICFLNLKVYSFVVVGADAFLGVAKQFPLRYDGRIYNILSVKDATHIKDPVGVAMKIIERFCAENKTTLESFYHVKIEGQDSYEALLLIGRESNCLKKKGEVDDTRATVRIINDWQKGLLMI